VIPLAVGAQIFDKFSFTLSLVLVNVLQYPSIRLLYRWFLPKTLFNRKLWVFLLGLPFYLFIYEFNARLAYLVILKFDFVPLAYRANLASVDAGTWNGSLIQNLDYTLLIILTAIGFLFIRELLKRQHEVDRLLSDKLKLELTQLKSQLQPHFFFNTLNNLYSLSLQGSPKTSVSIANLSGIMRYVLYEASSEQVLLAKEISFLQSYIDLERIRHSDEELIQFSVQGNPNGIIIAPLLFLPLIENSFKHSLHHRITGNQLQIIMTIDEDEITFQTSNLVIKNYSASKTDGGIGLVNLKKRLDLLYPDRHSLNIQQDDSRFIVTLTIKFNK
jgi:sensor histidine kinase YesM